MKPNYKTHPIEYRAWSCMKTRCLNPKFKDFHLYGGKGITIHSVWVNSFEAFFSDMGKRPAAGYSLDRFPDPKGNYEPNNCRWATAKEQARNWSIRNRLLAFQGRVLPLSQWAEELGLKRELIKDRLASGWTISKALSTPPIKERERSAGGTFA